MNRLDVCFSFESGAAGWAPIAHLAKLASTLLGGELVPLEAKNLGRADKLMSLRPRRRISAEAGLLAILRDPTEVYQLRASPIFRQGYDAVAVWIIDSFWHESLPVLNAFSGIDLVGYTRPNDEGHYRTAAGSRAIWLPWGTDALGLGTGGSDRPVDVLRVGRQPSDWDDDVESERECSAAGLSFQGRPSFEGDQFANQRVMARAYGQAKFVLAHCNISAPGEFTHPSETYITARWTDALAGGGTVAGHQPIGDRTFGELLWPGATLHFDRIDLRHNVEALKAACLDWTPAKARHNHLRSLAVLDWRWRLKEIADRFGMSIDLLDREIALLEQVPVTAP